MLRAELDRASRLLWTAVAAAVLVALGCTVLVGVGVLVGFSVAVLGFSVAVVTGNGDSLGSETLSEFS